MHSHRVEARAEVTRWDESPIRDSDRAVRLARASVAHTLTGDADSASIVEYIKTNREDGSASFVGLERFEGALLEKRGGYALQTLSVFEEGVARGEFHIIPGTGTGQLADISGSGGFHAPE